MNRQEAINLAQKIKAIRKEKFAARKISYPVLLRLAEMPYYKREVTMERLVQEGYADSVEDIRLLLRDKRVCLGVGDGRPVESAGMSDSVLDAGIQYLCINKDLL